MAEQKKGFFKRIFSFGSSPEDERVPEGGQTPRPSDTEVGVTGAPDPDLHREAAATSLADSEAGTVAADDPGRTEPLKEAESRGAPGEASGTGSSDEAQKKTSANNRSRWNG